MYLYLIYILILFLLPVFPFSMIVNKLLNTLNAKIFALMIFVLFVIGNLLLLEFKLNSTILEFFAVFTILFYSYRLIGVDRLKTFIMYLYPILSSLALLWNLIGGDILEFMAIKIPILLIFLTLFSYLSSEFGLIHKKSVYGLGSVLPRFSILFILSIMSVSSSMFFLGYEMLEAEISRLPIVYGISLIISWIFMNWGFIRVIEWLIFGQPKNKVAYKDLSNLQLSYLIILIMLSICFFIFYSLQGDLL